MIDSKTIQFDEYIEKTWNYFKNKMEETVMSYSEEKELEYLDLMTTGIGIGNNNCKGEGFFLFEHQL